MMQFQLSRELSKLLGKHLKPGITPQGDMLWRADVALIGADLCIVMQEQHTQYVMVMCGVSQENIASFPEFFADRFWRETLAICDQAKLHKRETLRSYLQQLCQSPVFQLDREFIEDGKIPKVIEKLERLFLHEREPLPVDGRSAFEFSYAINTRKPRSTTDETTDEATLTAAENMGNLCLNLIELRMKEEEEKQQNVHQEWIVESSDSVVTVDFAAHRRKR